MFVQGGAIAYAAAVASAYGVRACIVTAAGPDADLSVFKGHELHVVPSEKTLTFEHSYTWWGECLGTPDFIGSCGINLCYRYLHISIGMNSNNERSPLLMTKFA